MWISSLTWLNPMEYPFGELLIADGFWITKNPVLSFTICKKALECGKQMSMIIVQRIFLMNCGNVLLGTKPFPILKVSTYI